MAAIRSAAVRHLDGRPLCFRRSVALKEALEARGALAQLKARIRAEVFNALDDKSEPRPPLPRENLLINELIREYLEFNKYRYTASVLSAESGQPEVPLDRQFIANELNVVEDASASSVPLLYGLLSHFLSSGEKGGKVFLKSSGASEPMDRAVRPVGEARRPGVPETHPAGKSGAEPFVLQGGYR
uniref:Centrosomal protein 20 n=1 Tax=Paramormyrops kingsleyae TaxID=1676925 RepID=A0A3B3SHC7_9TELE